MAPILFLLGALLVEVRRASEGFLSFGRNHFGAFTLLLLVVAPPAAAAMQGLILLLVLPALARDPLHLLPRDRIRLLPLGPWQRTLLALLARLLNPVLWVVLVGAFFLRRNPLLLVFGLLLLPPCVEALGRRMGNRPGRLRRWHPPGRLGPLFLQGLRTFLRVPDPYLALLLSAWAFGSRIWEQSQSPGMRMGISLLLVLCMGTQAQCLLSAESRGERLRMMLLPLPGWRRLLLRDAAWMALLLPLVAPHDPGVGLGAGLAALAVGHGASLLPAPRMRRGHFLQGPSLGLGALQTVLMAGSGIAVHVGGAWILLPILVLWALSLVGFGFRLDHLQQ